MYSEETLEFSCYVGYTVGVCALDDLMVDIKPQILYARRPNDQTIFVVSNGGTFYAPQKPLLSSLRHSRQPSTSFFILLLNASSLTQHDDCVGLSCGTDRRVASVHSQPNVKWLMHVIGLAKKMDWAEKNSLSNAQREYFADSTRKVKCRRNLSIK